MFWIGNSGFLLYKLELLVFAPLTDKEAEAPSNTGVSGEYRCVYIYIFLFTFTYIYIYVCVYVHILYIYIYIYCLGFKV